jgi:hypothetical protein
LGASFAVANINKNEAAQIAPGMDPARENDRLPDVRRAKLVTMMRSFHVQVEGETRQVRFRHPK